MSKCYITLDDIPKSCLYCPCFEKGGSFRPLVCGITKQPITTYSKRLDDCPIQEVPEKRPEWYMDIVEHESMDLGKRIGWNACIAKLFNKGCD